jgi:hypothetical protein
MKTNKELNTEHDRRQMERVRPAPKAYDFAPLEKVIKQWVTGNERS